MRPTSRSASTARSRVITVVSPPSCGSRRNRNSLGWEGQHCATFLRLVEALVRPEKFVVVRILTIGYVCPREGGGLCFCPVGRCSLVA